MFTKFISEKRVDLFMNGYLEFSVHKDHLEEIKEFCKELDLDVFTREYQNGKYVHIRTTYTPCIELNKGNVNTIKNITRKLKKERIDKEIVELNKKKEGL